MNRNSFFKFQNESRIDDSRKLENRAYQASASLSSCPCDKDKKNLVL